MTQHFTTRKEFIFYLRNNNTHLYSINKIQITEDEQAACIKCRCVRLRRQQGLWCYSVESPAKLNSSRNGIFSNARQHARVEFLGFGFLVVTLDSQINSLILFSLICPFTGMKLPLQFVILCTETSLRLRCLFTYITGFPFIYIYNMYFMYFV